MTLESEFDSQVDELDPIKEKLKAWFLLIPGVQDVYWLAAWNVTSNDNRHWIIDVYVVTTLNIRDRGPIYDAEGKCYDELRTVRWDFRNVDPNVYSDQENLAWNMENVGFVSIK